MIILAEQASEYCGWRLKKSASTIATHYAQLPSHTARHESIPALEVQRSLHTPQQWRVRKILPHQSKSMDEIVIYDLECVVCCVVALFRGLDVGFLRRTTIPATDIIEFGAIRIDKRSFLEKGTYSTLIHSKKVRLKKKKKKKLQQFANPAAIKVTKRSTACNGITGAMLTNAPSFDSVANAIFELMDGKIWSARACVSHSTCLMLLRRPLLQVRLQHHFVRQRRAEQGVCEN